MKKVIFIGGTSYSGSTLLDMILSNDNKGYSLGEIEYLFRQTRKHHLEEIADLKKNNNWRKILREGEKRLFANLFTLFPDIEFFVSSSKNPIWINKQMKYLDDLGIQYKNVLIYKSPQELAHSFSKRDKIKKMEKSIRSYYRLYFHYINEFKSISYKQLINSEEHFIALCNYLNIDYFKEKKKYWNKTHTTFFGNNRARAHTDNLAAKGEERIRNLKEEGEKKLYYNPPQDKKLIATGNKIEKKYENLFKMIYQTNISSCSKINNIENNDKIFIFVKRIQMNILNFIKHNYSNIAYLFSNS